MTGVASSPDAERRKRVTRALANPIYFAEQYVRPFDPNWTSALPQFAKEMLAFAARVRRGVVMLPPEFLKTTLVSQVIPLWLTYVYTAEQKLLRGLLWSEEEDMAKANLNVLKWHIEYNDRLLTDFVGAGGHPLVAPDPEENVWREDAIIVSRRSATKDPTWQAKGLDSKGIHGRRLDLVIGDDVVTPRNAASPALRKQALDTMDLVVATRVVKTGRIVMAGNFNDEKDLLGTLARRPGWQLFKRPSMYVADKPETPPKESELHTAELTWPSNWDRARLLDEYRQTPNRFRRIHLMDPRAEHGERLNVSWVRLIQPDETPLPYCRFFIGVDPAPGGGSDDLDFFNVTVLALHDLHIDLVEVVDTRTTPGKQAKLVGHIRDRYQRIGGGVIAIGGQKQAMDRYFRALVVNARPDIAHQLVEIPIPGSKEERLEALGGYAQSGWLRVWEPLWDTATSSPEDRHQELTLMEQWRDFPFAGHDDKLDGLDIALRTAQEFSVVGDLDFDLEVAES